MPSGVYKVCRGTGLRQSELETLKGKGLATRAQIEAGNTRLEAIPEDKRTVQETKRLDMLKTEIARALRIDRGTVAKYYDEILEELQK